MRLIRRTLRYPVILALFAALFLSCALYHLQTPETVPVGKSAVGLGAFGWHFGPHEPPLEYPWEGYPGAWIRIGIAPKLDLGFHTWFLGLKSDIKYGLNRYLGFGAGLGIGIMPGIWSDDAYPAIAEASVYTGIPLGPFYPYGVGRIIFLPEPEDYSSGYISVGGVGGVKICLSRSLAFYAESGAGSMWGRRRWIAAFGMEIRP